MQKSSEEEANTPKKRAEALALIAKEEEAKFRSRALVPFNQLFNGELSIYQDLLEAAEKLFEKTLPKELLQEADSESAFTEAVKKIGDFFEALFQEIIELLKRSQERVRKLHVIADFQKKFLKCCEPFTLFADFKEKKAHKIKEIQSLTIPHSMLHGLETAKVDALIQAHYESYLAMQKSAPDFFEKMTKERNALLKLCTHATQTVKRRLFEIFYGITPFPDLLEAIQKLRSTLCLKIAHLQSLYFKGESRGFDLCQNLFDLAYEHDVQLLRNEIAFRATRLQELREENIHLLQAMLTARRYLHVASVSSKESIYLEVCSLCQELEQFLRHIENPFSVFKTCSAFENVNEQFRKLWVKMEDFATRVQKLKKGLHESFLRAIDTIENRLLRVADDLEEIEKEHKKIRPNLVVPLEHALHDELVPVENQWDVLLDECTSLEKQFSYCQPLSFFMAVDDFQLRKKLFLETIKLDAKISQAVQFAKALQFIKTFEEERVDTILEVFERQYLIEDDTKNGALAFESYAKELLQRVAFVEREVVLDIGLLDMRSLFDVDEKKLQEALLAAINKAKQQIPALLRDLEQLKPDDESAKKMLQALVYNIKGWEKETGTHTEENALLLKQLMIFCHFLFEAKMQMEIKSENSQVKYALLVSEMRAYVDFIEEFIQKKRQAKEGEGQLTQPWVRELHAVRGDVEALEWMPEEASVYEKAFDELFKKIEEIAEIKNQSEEEKRERLKLQNELLRKVKKAEIMGNKQLFHHIPGCLYQSP